MAITAAMLYNLVQCPHRVTMDLFANSEQRDPVSPFVQLLWERGTLYEKQVMAELELQYTDLSQLAAAEKTAATRTAMEHGDSLIYSGRIEIDDLVGEPDLLRQENGGYAAIDIKSGRGEAGGGEDDDSSGKPKKHYTVQLGLYQDILEQYSMAGGRVAYIWDIHGNEVPYAFDTPYGIKSPRTPWQDYQEALAEARTIATQQTQTRPALAAGCKLCIWYSACTERLVADDDLSLIPELGRARRDTMAESVPTVRELAETDIDTFMRPKNKTCFAGVGPDSLRKFQARAQLLAASNAEPYITTPLELPEVNRELFFDIEVDPLRDICYLHGFVERVGRDNAGERYVYFLAENPTSDDEEQAFQAAWAYIQDSQPCAVYFYSKYERTVYRKLREKFPTTCPEDELEALFSSDLTVDLYYDAVQKGTYWPTRDHSLKTLAKYLGFKWRDTDPSGAASIEWYDRWVTEGHPEIRQRILDYNEDDCRATRVLLDSLKTLKSTS